MQEMTPATQYRAWDLRARVALCEAAVEVRKDAFQEMPGNWQALQTQCLAERGHPSEAGAPGLPAPLPTPLGKHAVRSEHCLKVERPWEGRVRGGSGALLFSYTQNFVKPLFLSHLVSLGHPHSCNRGSATEGSQWSWPSGWCWCVSGCQGSQTSTPCTGEHWSKTLFRPIVCQTYKYSLLQRKEGGKIHYEWVL